MDSANARSVRSVRDVRAQAESIFADWIQIVDNKSRWTIEDFSYKEGVPEHVENHCWKCITVNHCWFANQDDKKPMEFGYDEYTSAQIAPENRGLYHPRCHCEKVALHKPQLNDISLIVTQGKIEFMWKSKTHLFHKWGYSDSEKDFFVEMIANKTKESYITGNYEIEKHDNHGVKINCIFRIPCKNNELGDTVEMWSNWMIFPNGTLKCNTCLGGWTK